jgi:hypothetical protein
MRSKTAPFHFVLAAFLAAGCMVGNEDAVDPDAVGDSFAAGDNVLLPGEVLWPDQALETYGAMLAYQSDGNLVLYRTSLFGPPTPEWASDTAGTSPGLAAMQDDGNFVIYDGSGNAVWSSQTEGNPGAFALIRMHRNGYGLWFHIFPESPECDLHNGCGALRTYP